MRRVNQTSRVNPHPSSLSYLQIHAFSLHVLCCPGASLQASFPCTAIAREKGIFAESCGGTLSC
jgi:hypothetical protein